jgi:CsoR family transcriptional regulator, copper-sensing transcriptional repressor
MGHHLRGSVRDRMSRANGHLTAVIRMLDEDQPYADILLQLMAVRGALEKATGLILEDMLDALRDAPKSERDQLVKSIREGIRVVS